MNALKLAFCSHQAAEYAVTHWHYSRSMPCSKLVKVGVWEDRFIGAVIFGWGATPAIGEPFGLKLTQVCELVRVAAKIERERCATLAEDIKARANSTIWKTACQAVADAIRDRNKTA